MNAVEFKNLSKSYEKNKAIDNITFEVKKGEIFGLLGPNGAGKSTLISMLTTILKPDSGKIFINGLDIFDNKNKVKKMLGFVPQELALYDTLSAKENLDFFGRMYNLKGANLKERVNECLQIAGLTERAKERVETYSGGMKRRLNIAVALLHNPEVLIMDEPTVGIDPQSRSHILDNILELNKKGMTVIYTSHYIEEVEYICKNIGIIDKGKLMAIGTKEDLKKIIGDKKNIKIKVEQKSPTIMLQLEKINGVQKISVDGQNGYKITVSGMETTISQILKVFENNNVNITGVDTKDVNLESVFLHLTGKELRD